MTPWVLPLAGLAAVATATLARGDEPWLLVNESRSLPRGLYLRASGPIAVGTTVTVRPPAPARRYLTQLGAPADARLLKRVVAGAGAQVCDRAGRLAWPGGSAPRRILDRRGARLPAWRDCRRLAADELLVIGDTALSFDSRYFGPVRRSAVRGPYKEVLRW